MEAGQALILLGHGSRDASWRAGIDSIRLRLQELEPRLPVVCAFLEFMSPTLPEAAAGAVASGARHVIVLPVFLGTGNHLRKDVLRMAEALSGAHPGCEFSVDPPLGEHPAVIEAAVQVALESLT